MASSSTMMSIAAPPGRPSVNAVPPPTSKVLLCIRCKGLADKDTFSKSDPQVLVYSVKNVKGKENVTLIGTTERIKNDLNPVFKTSFTLDYFFEELQTFRFLVVDVDDFKSQNVKDQDILGQVETTLGSILSISRGKDLPLKMPNGNPSKGTICFVTEEVSDCKVQVSFKIRGEKLAKMDLFGKSDPFFVISRMNADGTCLPVFTSNVIKNTLNPTWLPVNLPLNVLNGGDDRRQLKFECFDWERNGAPEYMGEFLTTWAEIVEGKTNFTLENKKKKKSAGTIIITEPQSMKSYTFYDYLTSGYRFNLMVAVDFTLSNGSPNLPTSLHFINPYTPNQYQKAMQTVGQILLEYDTDKMVPAYGFGGRFPSGVVSHCFPLNNNPSNPETAGISGLLAAYQAAINSVQLYGPTNMKGIIEQAVKISNAFKRDYLVLLILTDGVISDMQDTISAVIGASTLPISIVIVGVGGADFGDMVALDSDQGLLTNGKQTAARDIVQFVPYRDFEFGDPLDLSAAVLAEIPRQFLSWATVNNVKPPSG